MTETPSAALVISGIAFSYDGAPVLRGVDLTVETGVTAVLGASGSGKTTLLRVVAGFLRPTAGSVTVAGRTLDGAGATVPPRSRRIGYLPQEGALFPHLDVSANIAFGLPRDQRRGRRVPEMLDLVELPRSVGSRQPHELSGGQQQRVALARALAPEPALVLLDEPFSSLDAGLREDTGRAVVRALRASGAAALLVTHDQGEALSLADQVAVMDAGAFRQVASPADLYLSPVDATVAAFIGRASMIEATATPADDGHATSELGRLRLRGVVPPGPLRVAVRAEQVQLVAADDPDGTPARVLEVSYFGHDATVRVGLEPSATTLVARTPAASIPSVGAWVRVRVTGDVTAFPREQR